MGIDSSRNITLSRSEFTRLWLNWEGVNFATTDIQLRIANGPTLRPTLESGGQWVFKFTTATAKVLGSATHDYEVIRTVGGEPDSLWSGTIKAVARVESSSSQSGSDGTINITVGADQTISLTTIGAPGPRGLIGPPGPVGSLDDASFPDFTLIFENQLV